MTTKSLIISAKINDTAIIIDLVAPESLTKPNFNDLPDEESYIMVCAATFMSWFKIKEKTKKPAILKINGKIIFDNTLENGLDSQFK